MTDTGQTKIVESLSPSLARRVKSRRLVARRIAMITERVTQTSDGLDRLMPVID